MKNSIDNPHNATHTGNQSCSEDTCVTCFANRGCIYEQYMTAAIHTMEQSLLQGNIPAKAAINKRA